MYVVSVGANHVEPPSGKLLTAVKIVYCLNSISHLGGIAVVTIAKANALADIEGNEVYVCVSDYEQNAWSAKLSAKVHLIDLDIDYYADDWKSRWHVWKGIVVKRCAHRKKLEGVLLDIRPDIAVSVGQCEKYMLPRFKGNWVNVRELHYSSDYRQYAAKGLVGKMFSKVCDLYDFGWKMKAYDHIVLLTEEDRERNWRNAGNVSVIANPLTFTDAVRSSTTNKKIISAGRLEQQKNYASLIRAFGRTAEKHPDWTLEIYGDGSQKRELHRMIEEMNLQEKVLLRKPVPAIAEKMSEAACFVLSSLFEGFGLVIIEAMACGLPVVSYDCPCGPKDIISDGVDGFLVPAGDERELADKMNDLIEHPEKRRDMGRAALDKAENYKIEKIIPMWTALFEKLVKEKHPAC